MMGGVRHRVCVFVCMRVHACACVCMYLSGGSIVRVGVRDNPPVSCSTRGDSETHEGARAHMCVCVRVRTCLAHVQAPRWRLWWAPGCLASPFSVSAPPSLHQLSSGGLQESLARA